MTAYTTTTTTTNTNPATSTFSKAKRDWYKTPSEGSAPTTPPVMFNIRSAG